jgi:hypothetical protein
MLPNKYFKIKSKLCLHGGLILIIKQKSNSMSKRVKEILSFN